MNLNAENLMNRFPLNVNPFLFYKMKIIKALMQPPRSTMQKIQKASRKKATKWNRMQWLNFWRQSRKKWKQTLSGIYQELKNLQNNILMMKRNLPALREPDVGDASKVKGVVWSVQKRTWRDYSLHIEFWINLLTLLNLLLKGCLYDTGFWNFSFNDWNLSYCGVKITFFQLIITWKKINKILKN